MLISRMLTLCVFAILFCGKMSDSIFQNQRKQLEKLDHVIEELKEADVLDCCELPEDKNVVSTVIGVKVYENPQYIRRNFYANFRCKVPSSFQFLGGPTNIRCFGTDSTKLVNRQCVQLKNETDWQAALHQLDLDRSLCYNGSSNSTQLFEDPYVYGSTQLFKDPLGLKSYFQCVFETSSKSYKFVSQKCDHGSYVQYDSKYCVSNSDKRDLIEIGFKPSIVVDAPGSAWDSMGWLLVGRGSNVTLDCVYPKVTNYTDVTWYRNDFGNTDIYDGIQISGQWISEYRNRIVLNEVDYNNTGIYTCDGLYYSQKYYSETNSHAVTIALKEKTCSEFPLPDFELHHKYYRDYPFMNHAKRRCQETS